MQRMAAGWGVLALAALAVTACDPDPAPPFEIEGTGGVEGFLFFDANKDAAFSTLDGDFPVVGADVGIFERGTEQAFSGGTATTNANGRFTVTGLPAGTHDLV
ncbi:MAG: carboxypeptidase-like regulatory domain-containing protein, partial [Candidatus Longimicrobiales bacterium M2_2A_002]